LTRQEVPVIDPEKFGKLDVERGGYILADAENGSPDLILIATGSEVSLALEAKVLLEANKILTRVVSMPCLDLFDEQPEDYRNTVLPPENINRVSVEAGATTGWWKYTGLRGDVIGLDHFGASAPAETLYEKFGLTAAIVADRAKAVMQKNSTSSRK
jgi:transketolase